MDVEFKRMVIAWASFGAIFSLLAATATWFAPVAKASDSGPQPTVWEEIASVIARRSEELTAQEHYDLLSAIDEAKRGLDVAMVSSSITSISDSLSPEVILSIDDVIAIQAAAVEGIVDKEESPLDVSEQYLKPKPIN
jgi:hypothetical protein